MVAIGVAGYLNVVLAGVGLAMPAWAATGYGVGEGGVINLFAVLLCLLIAGLQIRGIEESTKFNSAMVILKLGIIAIVIAVGTFYVDPANLTPFFPFGIGGVFGGAALVFFAVFGFDAMTTAAEESRNPQRDLPRAVILSLGVALVLYVLMSLVMTGIVPYTDFATPTQITDAFQAAGLSFLAIVVAVAAFASILSVLFAFMLSSSRIWFAVSRDGLLPRRF